MYRLVDAEYNNKKDELTIKLRPIRKSDLMETFVKKLNEIKNFRVFHILTSAKSDYTDEQLMDAAEAFEKSLGEE